MRSPLSRYAPSPQGDNTFAAERPLLGVSRMGRAAFKRIDNRALAFLHG